MVDVDDPIVTEYPVVFAVFVESNTKRYAVFPVNAPRLALTVTLVSLHADGIWGSQIVADE